MCSQSNDFGSIARKEQAMYYDVMTIKRRLFFSNTRMLIISFITFGVAVRIVMFLAYGPEGWPGREAMAQIRDVHSTDMAMARSILFIVLFIIFMSIINSFLSYRMTKRIVKPLEPLGEGVRQIQENNLAFRIDYKDNDEFRSICDAFNEMAEKLETSTAKQKKDEANRRELIAGISHDLRTPLTSIKGYVEGIKTGVASTTEMQEKYLDIINNKAAVMEHIIEQLFLFSKLDMDEFPLAMRKVNISFAICDIIEDALPEYTSRGLDIQFDEMQDNTHVSADVLMLRNVIINILENSVKYKTKERGQIKIGVSVVDNFVLLRLADDGSGVQADMLPKLFDVFYRTDPSRSKSGSGLGLAICAKIIERMGGSIHAEQPTSGGLAIIIKLPLLQGDGVLQGVRI
jgi:signal transduction histidine kinase